MGKKCTPSKRVSNAAKTLSTSSNKAEKSKAGAILKSHQDRKH